VARTTALVARLLRELADDRDLLRRAKREDSALVLQEHDRAPRGLARQRVVGVDVELLRHGRTLVRAADEVQHALGGAVEVCLVEFAGLDGGDELAVAEPVRRRHLEIHAGLDALGAYVRGAPVADDEALEAPLVA